MKEPASDSSAQPIASCGKNDEAGAIVILPSASGSGRYKSPQTPAGFRDGLRQETGMAEAGESVRTRPCILAGILYNLTYEHKFISRKSRFGPQEDGSGPQKDR